jgi:hypothetical protein
MTTAIRRRPRRSNTLKDIGRLIGIARTNYDDRKHRLHAHAALLVDTEAAAWSNYWKIRTINLQASGLGFTLVPNDRVFHVLEEWRGAFGNALLDDGPVGDALRHLRDLSLDRAAPPQAKKLATQTKEKINEAIIAQREANPEWLEASERVEQIERILAISPSLRAVAREIDLFARSVRRDWSGISGGADDCVQHRLGLLGPTPADDAPQAAWDAFDRRRREALPRPISDAQLAAEEAVGQLRINWWDQFMPTVNGHRVTPQGMPSPEIDFGELTIREPRRKGERDPNIKPPRPWNDPRPDPIGSPRTVVDHVLKGKSRNFNPLGLEGDYEPAFRYEDDDE